MKFIHRISLLMVLAGTIGTDGFAQTLQLHYDLRHTVDPTHTSANFPSLYFEYFKTQDSGKAFIKPGSFLFKMQADLAGSRHNISQVYFQASQSFRCWQPKIYLNLQYSGGLGVTEPKQYSYYISSTYSAGINYPFRWGTAYLVAQVNYQIVNYKRPSNDPLLTLYWWKGVFHYRAELAGDFSAWTENRNQGDDLTKQMQGKRFFFFAEPQFWYRVAGQLSVGTKINMYYHVITSSDLFEVYPTIAVKWKL